MTAIEELDGHTDRLTRMGHRSAAVRAAAVVACVLAASACGQAAGTVLMGEQPRDVVSVSDADALPEVVAAADSLGLRLLRYAEVGNAVTSPAGAQVTLAMVGEGAAGPAATQLDVLLGAAGQSRTDAMNALLGDLEPLGGDPSLAAKDELPDRTLVHLANQVTIDDQAVILPAYLDRLSSGYGIGVTGTDLGSDEGKKVLDAWLRKETGGLVEESAIEPEPLLRLVWQNALVIAARWEQPFDPVVTSERPFTLADGESVAVQMMFQLTSACYAEHEGWRAIRLPYAGGELVADLVLPPAGREPAELTPEQLASMTGVLDCGTDTVEVLLGLPKADLRTNVDMLPLLEDTVPDLLVPGGLPEISSAEPLFVSQAVQQGVVRIDEEGTVAAVVTEVGAEAGSASPEESVVLTFDRPYLARIATTSTDWSLVLARIDDPRG